LVVLSLTKPSSSSCFSHDVFTCAENKDQTAQAAETQGRPI
jgi:hypothetical protein